MSGPLHSCASVVGWGEVLERVILAQVARSLCSVCLMNRAMERGQPPRITPVTGSYLALQRRMAHTDFTVALWREKELGRAYEGLLSSFRDMGSLSFSCYSSYMFILSPICSLITELKSQTFTLMFGWWKFQVLSDGLKGDSCGGFVVVVSISKYQC